MSFKLYTEVILKKDMPKEGFKAGDVGTIVEQIKKPKEGYLVEFFDQDGNTISVLPVSPSQISVPKSRSILNYRKLNKVA